MMSMTGLFRGRTMASSAHSSSGRRVDSRPRVTAWAALMACSRASAPGSSGALLSVASDSIVSAEGAIRFAYVKSRRCFSCSFTHPLPGLATALVGANPMDAGKGGGDTITFQCVRSPEWWRWSCTAPRRPASGPSLLEGRCSAAGTRPWRNGGRSARSASGSPSHTRCHNKPGRGRLRQGFSPSRNRSRTPEGTSVLGPTSRGAMRPPRNTDAPASSTDTR